MDLELRMDVHICLGPSTRNREKAQNSMSIDNLYRSLDFTDSEIHLESAPSNHSPSPYDFIYKGLLELDARHLAHEIQNQLEGFYAKAVKRK